MFRFDVVTYRISSLGLLLTLLSGCLMNAETDESSAASPPPPPSGNRPPSIAGAPPSVVKVGVMYNFVPVVSDADNDPLQFSIENQPTWASFDQGTGALSGMPLLGSEGTYSGIVVRVSDGTDSASLPPFSVVVEPATASNMPPQLSGNPPGSVVVGASYSFTPTAFDPDGDNLTFSISNPPSWANFNTASGALTGTPVAADAGTYNNISITVSDGTSTASIPAFSISVVANNSAPTISGNPPTQATVGQTYSFTPSANDPDGDNLTFSVVNRPGWLSFDTSSGQLSGTPAANDVGTYSNIVVSVSDGSESAALPAFDLVVGPGATGSVTLNWDAPTLNVDGTPLTDLASYRIYYGTSATSLNTTIDLNNAGLTTYTVDNLSLGTYYFSMTAFNSAGEESDRSGVAQLVVN